VMAGSAATETAAYLKSNGGRNPLAQERITEDKRRVHA